MDSVNDLKNDIIKTNAVVKQQQSNLKEKIDNGIWDSSETFFDDPNNNNYYAKALVEMAQDRKNLEIEEKKRESFWGRVKRNIRNMLNNNE